jgi:hypothetical protein
MEARSSNSGSCGSIGGGTHEHGECEVASGGQAKVLKLVGVSWNLWGVRPRNKSKGLPYYATRVRTQVVQ